MKNILKRIHAFLAGEDGPTAVEYAIMLALIVIACVGIVTTLGSSASSTFSTANSAFTSS